MDVLDKGVGYSLARVMEELGAVAQRVIHDDPLALASFAGLIVAAPRVFILGSGRSGLALRMTGMRLMHLGLKVHVVGEVTSPAIAAHDLLLTASGSGTTGSVVRAAETARSVGAKIAAITTDPASPLAALASTSIIVPAAGKLDRTGSVSAQYAGSLFEQSVVVIGDALFHALWQRSGLSADDLWPRHANIE